MDTHPSAIPTPSIGTVSVPLPNVSTATVNNLPQEISTVRTSISVKDQSNNIDTLSTETVVPKNESSTNFTLLHHSESQCYVLTRYCSSLKDNISLAQSLSDCKHPSRECIIYKTKSYESGTVLTQLSPTVILPNVAFRKRFGYDMMEGRIINCAQPTCKNSTKTSAKQFHFSCYMHNIKAKTGECLSVLKIEDTDDKLLDVIKATTSERTQLKNLLKDTIPVVVPVCGLRCFKLMNDHRMKSSKKSKPTLLANDPDHKVSWEKDGEGSIRSSMEILIDWFTTEENVSKYYGGVDRFGKTNADRKEGYHLHIKELIQKENG
jgi:hypothetical protein